MKISIRNFHDGQLKEKKRLRLLRRLALDKKVRDVMLIIRIGDDANLLHIMSPKEKDRLLVRQRPLVLVGIAKDMEGSYEVVREISELITGIHKTINGPLIDKELDIHWDS